MNNCVTDHISATRGCFDRICGLAWGCTEHVTYNGEQLHVGSNIAGIVGVQKIDRPDEWINTQKVWQAGGGGGHTSPPWSFVVDAMEKDPRFSPPPTDEEVQAAAQGALRLLKEMTR